MLALAVLLSVAGLALGPALVALGRGSERATAAVEGLTLGIVPALVVLRLLPHVYGEIGPLALLLALAGYLTLWQMDLRRHGTGERFGHALVVPALAAHALTDGAGLALSVAGLAHGVTSAGVLAAAIVLHRLPEGLFLATELVPEIGWRRTMYRVGALAACTVLGAVAGSSLLEHVSDTVFDGAVSVGLGMIVRLVVHSHAPLPKSRSARAVGGAAFALGVAGAAVIPAGESVLDRAQPSELSVVRSLLPLFVETAPAMLAGLAGAGLLAALWPARRAPGDAAATDLGAALRGVMQAPAMAWDGDTLLRSVRARLASGERPQGPLALAASASELSADAAALSFRLLGLPLALLRVAASALLALALALLTARASARGENAARGGDPGESHHHHHPHHHHDQHPSHDHPDGHHGSSHQGSGGGADVVSAPVPPPPLDPGAHGAGVRLRVAASLAFGPLLDRVAAWYLVGLVAAATLEAALRSDVLARVGSPLDVLLGALLAVPLYVGAPGATPVAAMMVHKGFSAGAALAFALVGPGTNPGLLRVVRAMLGARAALVLAAGAVALACAVGIAVNALVSPGALPSMHAMLEHPHPGVEWSCAGALAAALLASLLRLGPRAWFGHMAPGGHDLSGH